ncbi:DDE superfamily endonuclease [Aliiruegeria haliotis]|uniref:DDE superfamily endonuclease n=1 Tax=Aliiruegeria haliotis TaxID=1280846 RepID=A0A2T0RMA0_9RHOB|nr:DDE superfamily endonuclease [Aliiruegeria haliotis]
MKINGERHYLWQAVEQEGEVLESFVTQTQDERAALRFIKQTMRRYGRPETIVTDLLRSCGTALKEFGVPVLQETDRWLSNRRRTRSYRS